MYEAPPPEGDGSPAWSRGLRHLDPGSDGCPECGSLWVFGHGPDCSRSLLKLAFAAQEGGPTMNVLQDPWTGDLTRDTGDGVLEVYCPEIETWVQACVCGPHIQCPEHACNCVYGDWGRDKR